MLGVRSWKLAVGVKMAILAVFKGNYGVFGLTGMLGRLTWVLRKATGVCWPSTLVPRSRTLVTWTVTVVSGQAAGVRRQGTLGPRRFTGVMRNPTAVPQAVTWGRWWTGRRWGRGKIIPPSVKNTALALSLLIVPVPVMPRMPTFLKRAASVKQEFKFRGYNLATRWRSNYSVQNER